MRKIGVGDVLFAISLAGLAVLAFVYGNFAPIVAPLPGPKVLTYGLAVVVFAAGVGLFFARTVAGSAIVIAICAVGWAVARSAPIFHQPLNIGSWYGTSEAVSVLVGVWTLYSLHRRPGASAGTALTGDRTLRVGRILFGVACLVYGIAHFVYAAYTLPFVPTWLPARMPLVYLTGAFHAAAGVGLILGILPRLAARLEAIMIFLFGALVWVPSLLAHPAPKWAGSAQNQWSETLLTFVLGAVAWIVADAVRRGSGGRARK
ncbi:MAG TPA: hypothetical protein VHE61_01180 [Opitutaceae bacterium]|nr:hypothetical protein [Opitutaceae bacterium]